MRRVGEEQVGAQRRDVEVLRVAPLFRISAERLPARLQKADQLEALEKRLLLGREHRETIRLAGQRVAQVEEEREEGNRAFRAENAAENRVALREGREREELARGSC